MSSRGAALLVVMPVLLLVSSIDATQSVMKRACKGDTLAMRCLQDRHILVRTVYFGRSNETICHKAGSVTSVTCTNNKDESLQKIQDNCDYKRSCFINHSDLVDDCGNSYLEVEFMCCKTAPISRTATVCKHQHGPFIINCANGNAIKIIDAEYGRGDICPPQNKNSQIIWGKQHVSQKLGERCDGSQNCEIPANLFSSTGEHTGYLEVHYVCPFPVEK